MMRIPSHLGAQVQFKTEGQRLRVFQRAHIKGQVMVHDDSHLFIAPLQNISAGGVFVGELMTLGEGCLVRVVVKSKSLAEPVQATGTVVRIEKANFRGLAIEFTSISSRAREIIQNCVFETRMEKALKVT